MAPVKKKATAGTTSTSTEPGRTLDGPQPQHEAANPQTEEINNEAAPYGHSHYGEWQPDAVCPGRCGGVVGI